MTAMVNETVAEMILSEDEGMPRHPACPNLAMMHPNLGDGISSWARKVASRQTPLAWIVPGGKSSVRADVVKIVEMLPCRAPERSISAWVAAVSV